MTGSKKLGFFGNWKMAQTLDSCAEFFNTFKLESNSQRQIALIPSFTHLSNCAALIKKTNLKIFLGGQDCSSEPKGAFTGETSAAQLKEQTCEFVLVGHSERRQRGGETNESLKKKLDRAFEAGLTPIYCIGETEAERNAGKVFDILDHQLQILSSEKRSFIIAYEPVWAIGTGRTPSLEDIDQAHGHIWKKVPQTTSVLYGGSAKPENAKDILKISSVTGLLVGGASLKAGDFSRIIESAL
jgi:triosephosphate isomerase